VFTGTVRAHPEGLSVLKVLVEDHRVRAEMVLPAHVLPSLYPATPNAKDAMRLLEKDAADVLELRLNYGPVSPSAARARAEGADSVVLEMEFPATTPTGGPVTALQVYSNRLPKLGAGHRQLLEVHDARGLAGAEKLPPDAGRVVARHALTAGGYSAFVDLPAPGSPTTVPDWQQVPGGVPPPDLARPSPPPLSFFHLGVEHILTGYDHLLFLAALLLACRGFGEAAKIVTCFTVAHSITLALAVLDVVRLSPRIVEPLIAATIVYVAAENLFQARAASSEAAGSGAANSGNAVTDSPGGRVVWRMAITFGFGLVHGLGFASALRESGVGSASRGLLAPLLRFNLGVEAGQLAVAAVVFPLLLAMRRRPAFHYERLWVPACSALVALAGAWWLVQRVAFA
jgi:hypothetical protein